MRAFSANDIERENEHRGTIDWIIENPALNNEIEGYASSTSVELGHHIDIFVNTTGQSFDIEVFRMGWYQGDGARRMKTIRDQKGFNQPGPLNSNTLPHADGLNTIFCNWNHPVRLNIPRDWCSGVYLAKLTSDQGFQRYVIFVVREDPRRSDLTLQLSMTTYQAYNSWSTGGSWSNLYGGGGAWINPATDASNPALPVNQPNGTGVTNRAYGVSFDRPFGDGFGASYFFMYEYPMIRWLERNHYDVKYCSNVDTDDRDYVTRTNTQVLLTGGYHFEYCSREMRRCFEHALANGRSLGFFSANNMYWQIRFKESYPVQGPYGGVPKRVVICYKDLWAEQADPITAAHPELQTTRFRDLQAPEPEQEILGVMYGSFTNTWQPGYDFYAYNTDSWPFKDTGFTHWEPVRSIMLGEIDYIHPTPTPLPDNILTIGASPVVDAYGNIEIAHTTIFQAPGGGLAFSAGTFAWSWGLDDLDIPSDGPADWQKEYTRHRLSDERLEKLTHNILDGLIRPHGWPYYSVPLPSGSINPNAPA